MEKYIVACVIIFNDNTTKYTEVDVTMLSQGEILFNSIKKALLDAYPNSREVQIIDVMRVIKIS